MWTNKNRARYDRSKLRYPSDLTDEEWGLVELAGIPPGKTGGGEADGDHAGGGERPHVHSLDWLSVARDPERSAPGKARSTTTSIMWTYDGTHWSESTTRSINSVANERKRRSQPDGRDHRQPKRQGRRKRGARALIRTGTMRARRSRARSGTFLSTQ